jgi:Ca-activated chloride channel family protein
MGMKILTLYISLFICLLTFSSTALASPAKAVSEGNKLYHQKKYDDAIKKYDEAKAESPDSDIVNFNLGTALYKKGSYQEAVDAFTKAAETKDKKLEAKTIYNIANSKYKLGSLKDNTDPNSAAGLYRESLDYYNRTLELDKNDNDARYNHDFVERKLKALLEKLKKQPPQQKREQGQDKKDRQENKGAQEKSGQEKPGDKQQQKSDGKQTETMGEKDKQGAKEKGAGAEERGASGEKTKEMSPEEARMLLDAYKAEEAGAVLDRERKAYHEEVLKDW